MGVVDKDNGIGHICLHQTLRQKQGKDAENKGAPLHKTAGQDGLHRFSFRCHQSQQANDCGNQYAQECLGCPAEILPKGGNAQHQAEEDQHQYRANAIKVLKGTPLGILLTGSQYADDESDCANSHAYPQHGTPAIGGDDQATQSRSENNRRAGNQHIQRKPLCYLVGWKTRDDIGHDHRGHSGSTNAHNESGYHHKHEGICQC